jgi:O-antigen/teichoic acid export membrane protein
MILKNRLFVPVLIRLSNPVFSFLSVYLITNFIDVETYGDFTKYLQFTIVLSTFSLLGYNSKIQRELLESKRNNRGLLFWEILFDLLPKSILVSFGLTFILYLFFEIDNITLFLIFLASLLKCFSDFTSESLFVINKLKASILNNITPQIIFTLLLIFGVYFEFINTYIDILYQYIVSYFFTLLISLSQYKKYFFFKYLKLSINNIHFNSKLFLISIITIINTNLFYFLSDFLGMTKTEVSVYSVYFKICSIVVISLSLLNSLLATNFGINNHRALINFKKFQKINIPFTIIVSILLLLFKPIFDQIFNTKGLYSESFFFFLLILLAQLINAISGPVGMVLIMRGRESILFYLLSMNFFISVTTSILGYNFFNLIGFGFSILISSIIINFTSYIIAIKSLRQNEKK